MTPKEAIEIIKIAQAEVEWNYPMDYAEAFDKAIKFLNKNIPREISYEDVGYDFYRNVNLYACKCPTCGLEIIHFDDSDIESEDYTDDVEKMFKSSMVHHGYIGLNNFCNRCGQKLKWDGDEE